MDLTVRGNVLVVEDDPDCGHLIVRLLSTAGYGVRWAPSREIAVDALQRYLYEYVILDLRMPGMQTEEFLNRITASRTIHVILMTAAADAQKEAQRLGISTWLGKPFAPEDLVLVMRGLSSGVRKIPPRHQST